jgi:hypothetical protein
MIEKTLQTFTDLKEADEAAKRERWALTVDERLEILETLRSYHYPDGKTAPRLQRTFESVPCPWGSA